MIILIHPFTHFVCSKQSFSFFLFSATTKTGVATSACAGPVDSITVNFCEDKSNDDREGREKVNAF
jgi:hypothetical protein